MLMILHIVGVQSRKWVRVLCHDSLRMCDPLARLNTSRICSIIRIIIYGFTDFIWV